MAGPLLPRSKGNAAHDREVEAPVSLSAASDLCVAECRIPPLTFLPLIVDY